MAEIRTVEIPSDLENVRGLFREYAAGLGIGLEFQGFDEELVSLPGKYQSPKGCLLLAWNGNEAVGCAAFRPLDDIHACEMKRLYVRPELRGERVGRRLAERICDEARAAGYKRICLDTLPEMQGAIRLYRDMAFHPIAPYVFNPVPGALFLGLNL